MDTSAILAFILNEPGGEIVANTLDMASISTVNLAEVYTFSSRNAHPSEPYDAAFGAAKIEIFSLTSEMAVAAGKMAVLTKSAGLSLGDRCCLALAQDQRAVVLTADRAWLQFAEPLGLEIKIIR